MAPLAQILDEHGKVLCQGSLSYQNVTSLKFYPKTMESPELVEKSATTLIYGVAGRFAIYSCLAVTGPAPLHFRLNLVSDDLPGPPPVE